MRLYACLFIVLQATFSVRTEMVVLPVTVTDARGQSVTGLTADDFRVFDNGRLQPIPGGKPFTSDAVELASALNAGTPGGRTALYDAVALGLQHLPAGQAQRKALIVVTDGGDNASALNYGDVRDLARASHAVIYGIGLTGSVMQEENPNILKRLCVDSGGTAHFPPATADIADVVRAVARDLRTQYTIGFAPAPAGPRPTFHTIRVHVASPQGDPRRVRTRAGYTVRPSP